MTVTGDSTKKLSIAWTVVGLAALCLLLWTLWLIMWAPPTVGDSILPVSAALAAYVAFIPLRKRRLIRVIAPAIVALTVLYVLGDMLMPANKRSYWAFYESIHSTMTSAEVQRQFHLHFPDHQANGWPKMVVWSEGMQFVLDPRSGDYNAELIKVSLTDNRVSDKRYLPD